MYSTTPQVTKEWLYDKLPQEYLMEHYLGIPIQPGLVCSPLRADKHPTCGFVRARSTGDLLFNDLSGDFTGDAIGVVARQRSISYREAIQYIAKDQGLLSGNVPPIVRKKYPILENKPSKIDVKLQSWSNDTLKYWGEYGISVQTLEKYNVFPVSVVWLNDRVYSIVRKNPVYAYYFGDNQWKIYWPGRKEHRFICNTNAVQGFDQLEEGDLVVVTKSLKDVMVLYELGVPAIALQGEAQILTPELYEALYKRYGKVIINYDWDRTGCRSMQAMRKKYDVECISLRGPKDISDFVKAYSFEAAKKLIDQTRLRVDMGYFNNKHHGVK